MPLFETLRAIEEDASFTPRVIESLVGFVSLIDDLALKAADAKVEELVEDLLERTGYRGYVEKSDEKDFRTRLEVVDEFVAACAEFDKRGGGTLADFLHELALVSDTDELAGAAPAVSMLTCHSAKGLEFDHVFLVGMEEGFLPHISAVDDDEDLEEERRLCYVAMTRARKTLTLTAARERTVYGRGDARERSRFLREIPADQLQLIKTDDPGRATIMKPPPPRSDGAKLKTGVRVRHAHFGTGTVMYTSGSDAKQTVQIRFDAGRIRKFVVSKAPIEVLEGKTR
jgi:DNA helicase-2/ATP-dependent DNA helicase PcrA